METMLYTFHRKEGWSPFVFKNDEEAIKSAKLNQGTLSVVNWITKETIYGEAPLMI